MLFYLLMHFLNPTGESLPNPFKNYSYGIGVNMCIEIVLVGISYIMFKLFKDRTNKYFAIICSIILWILNYIITWSCFWIENTSLAMATSVFAVVGFDMFCLVIIDFIIKKNNK